MRTLFLPLALACLLLADDAPQGVPARPHPADYASSASWKSVTFAASLVPSKQVSHLFAFDISRSFVVFEVAFYPDSSAALKLSCQAFGVKPKDSLDPVHPTEAETVASVIERQNQPSIPYARGLGIETAATIGIQHGTDPYSGRPTNGVYTAGQVSTENGRRDNSAPQDSKPGGTSEDRRILAAQLRVRNIIEGPVNHPVAGYIYFRKSDIRTQSDGAYALQYLAEEDGTGATHAITLVIPAKAH